MKHRGTEDTESTLKTLSVLSVSLCFPTTLYLNLIRLRIYSRFGKSACRTRRTVLPLTTMTGLFCKT